MPRFVNTQVIVASAVTLLLGFGLGLGYSHLGNGHRHAQARAGGLGLPSAPSCPPRASAVPTGVDITLTASSSFARDCYYAPAGQRFTISLTNPVFTLDGHSPTYARRSQAYKAARTVGRLQRYRSLHQQASTGTRHKSVHRAAPSGRDLRPPVAGRTAYCDRYPRGALASRPTDCQPRPEVSTSPLAEDRSRLACCAPAGADLASVRA